MKYTKETMWQAVINCDSTFDNEFLYGVKTVGVYCKPSCKSKKPLQKNIIYFENAKEAEKQGYRACKRCCPDQFEKEGRLAYQMKNVIDHYYCEKKQLSNKLKQLGASANHLTSSFKKQYGVLPREYILEKKIEESKRLLAESEISIIDIAENMGFESLSSFYKFFKKHTQYTPKKYRLLKVGGNKYEEYLVL